MALCKYCEAVEIAWHQTDRRWVACEAQRDAAGEVVRVGVRSGTRTVMRPVPNTERPHYPHVAGFEVSACPAWTPELARKAVEEREAKRGRGGMRRHGWRPAAAGIVWEPAPLTAPAARTIHSEDRRVEELLATEHAAAIPTSAGIETATVGDVAPTRRATAEPTSTPVKPEEPEALLPREALAAWARAERAIGCSIVPTRVLLWGPPGTGKTELPHRMAQRENWTSVYQLMTEETPATELLGHLIVQAGSTVWCDGTLGRAIRASHAGHVVYIIDEIGRASQDALSACLLALTNAESLRLTLRSGEVISPKAEHWHVVCTSNDAPDMLPPAIADRLHITVNLTHPHPDLVRSMTTVEARRLACAESREYSIRALLTYDRLRAGGMSRQGAAEIVWEPAAAQSFVDAAKLERLS